MHSKIPVSQDSRRKGIALIVSAAMSIVALPMVGMSIDVGLMYVIKTKLSAAADAAAIAGARTLNRGVDFNTQKANAIATADNYFRANFANGYLLTSASSMTTTVVASGLNSRIVTSNATATVPVYFLRFLKNGPPSVTVAVSAVATRRDSNVMMVLDRSKSLANASPEACTPMKTAAAGFVDKFAEQTDYLGMVTFASTSYYMDFPIATSFKTSTPTLPSVINSIDCVGGTSSAMGLWNGYTALANIGQPGALNVIVFFTDGNPTGITGQFPLKGSSACSNALKAQVPGVFGVLTYGGSSPWGLIKPSISASPVDGTAENAAMTTDMLTTNATTNCAFRSSQTNVGTDISGLPTSGKDYYGNLLTGYSGTPSVSATGIESAATNAADDAANRIRSGAVITAVTPGAPAGAIGKSLANVVIFSIGIGAVDETFMKRVANTIDSPVYNSAQQSGFYKYCVTVDDLQDAFEEVAAEVLRLSK